MGQLVLQMRDATAKLSPIPTSAAVPGDSGWRGPTGGCRGPVARVRGVIGLMAGQALHRGVCWCYTSSACCAPSGCWPCWARAACCAFQHRCSRKARCRFSTQTRHSTVCGVKAGGSALSFDRLDWTLWKVHVQARAAFRGLRSW